MRHAGDIESGEEFGYEGSTYTRIGPMLNQLPYQICWLPSASAWFGSWMRCHQNSIIVQEKETGAILTLDCDRKVYLPGGDE